MTKQVRDFISANWIRWIGGLIFAIILGFNTYIINRVDAVQTSQKEFVTKEAHVRDTDRIEKGLDLLDKKLDEVLKEIRKR